MIGTPDSWDPAVSLSGKDKYNACVWSPCGRFIAAQTKERIEVRNHLTLELLAVLQYPKPSDAYWSYLAYSPDGRSLACVLPNCLVIWDIQTGAVAQSIDSGMMKLEPVWSSDGRKITVETRDLERFAVRTYDVASGAQFSKTESGGGIFHLWECGESFRILALYFGPDEMTISEIGPIWTRNKSLREISLRSSEVKHPPYAYRVPLSSGAGSILVLATGNSHLLLWYPGYGKFGRACLSSDGSHLATFHNKGFSVWKYTSGSFVFFRDFPGFEYSYSNFSPTSTSILSRHHNILQVWRLHSPPTTPQTCRQHAAISRSGRYSQLPSSRRALLRSSTSGRKQSSSPSTPVGRYRDWSSPVMCSWWRF